MILFHKIHYRRCSLNIIKIGCFALFLDLFRLKRYYLMTSVRFKLDCEECCTSVHSQAAAKRHKEVPLKRLKVQIDEFLSEDDWLW